MRPSADSPNHPAAEATETSITRLRAAMEQIAPSQISDLAAPQSHETYTRRVLVDSPDLQLIAARWRGGASCDLHGHSESVGLTRAIEGQMFEEQYRPVAGGYQYVSELLRPGKDSFVPRGAIHQLHALEDAVTIHAYAPQPDDAVQQITPQQRKQLEIARQAATSIPQNSGTPGTDNPVPSVS